MPCSLDIEINQFSECVDLRVVTPCETVVIEAGGSSEVVELTVVDSPCVGGGNGSAFIRTAGEAISALRAVYELPSGAVHPLSADDAGHIDLLAGITITSAAAGQEITVQRAGPLDASGLNLQPGRVWLGMDGALTQTPPDTGFDTLLGYATAEQRLYIDISESIQLED